MSKYSLLMLVANAFENDARVHRTACALVEMGLEVTLLAVQKGDLPEQEMQSGYQIIRLDLLGSIANSTDKRPGRKNLIVKFLNILRKLKRIAHRLIPRFGESYLCSEKVKNTAGKVTFQKRKFKALTYAWLVRNKARELKPDLIHAHDFHCLLAAHEIWKESKIPFVYDSHELWLERNRVNGLACPQEKQWEREMEVRAIRHAKFCITVCDSIATHLAKAYLIKQPVVIRNTPVRRSVNPSPERNLRRAVGLKQTDFVALYLGKATYNRGLMDILQALPAVDARVKFVALGYFDPRFEVEFKAAVKERALQDRVFFYGPVDVNEVADWISDCDLSLTTMNGTCLSYVYTLPNKLFESIQAGLPIIGPNAPEIRGIVQRYHCGLTYEDRNAEDLAAKINQLVHDPQQLAIFRQGSQKAALGLCWEKEREKLYQAYAAAFPEFIATYSGYCAQAAVRRA